MSAVSAAAGWPWVRLLGAAAYCAVLAGYVVVEGVPLDRVGISAWLVAGLVAFSLGAGWRVHLRTVVDWLPLVLVLLVYDHTRGVADSLGFPLHLQDLVVAERALFDGALPTAVLQARFHEPGLVHWYDVVAGLVYVSHFVLPWVVGAVLYLRARPAWAGYLREVVALSAAGLATYVVFPAAPPWYAAQAGVLEEPVERITTSGWSQIGLHSARALLDRAQADVNLVAAMPSLHAAFALLVAVTVWRHTRSVLARTACAVYPVAMGVTLVYGGEHYVIDVVLGFVYTAGVLAVSAAWQRRRSGAPPDPVDDRAGALLVGGPDEDPQARGGPRDRGVHARTEEGDPERLGLDGAAGRRDVDEQAVVAGRTRPSGDRSDQRLLAAAEGPAQHDDEQRHDENGDERPPGVRVAAPRRHPSSVRRRAP